MAPRSPNYSTKTSQPGVAGQLADLQKYGRSMTPIQWFGRTTNNTATELAVDNLRYSLPASTSPSTALLGRLLIPADSIATIILIGAAFDVTADINTGSVGNASFNATFSCINITGTVVAVPSGGVTITTRSTLGAASLGVALTFGTGGTATDSAVMLTVTGLASSVINWHFQADVCLATFNGSPAGEFGI